MCVRQSIGVSATVLIALSVTGGIAHGQDSGYYQIATDDLHQETVRYVQMLRHLKATGQPDEGADTFAFSAPWANSPLFDPFLAAQRTVADALSPSEGCVSAINSASAASFMLTGEITNSLLDVQATLNHLAAIQSAGGVGITLTDHELVSNGLPLTPPSNGAIEPAQKTEAGVEFAAWMDAIELHATAFAGGVVWSPSTTLTGGEGPIVAMVDEVWTFSIDVLERVPDDVVSLRGMFGIYGSLPMLAVWGGDHYFLIDAVTGAASGPYHRTTPYNAVGLLSRHEAYQLQTPVMILDQDGCVAVMP